MSRERQYQSIIEQDRVSFHRIKEYESNKSLNNSITVSFETNRVGIFQIGFTEGRGMIQFLIEPSLYMFTEEERKYMEYVLVAIFMFLYPTAEIDKSMLNYIDKQ